MAGCLLEDEMEKMSLNQLEVLEQESCYSLIRLKQLFLSTLVSLLAI